MNESAPASCSESRFDRFIASYRKDHQHPANHILHVWVGWPLCALAVILLPFRPIWSVGLFLGGYALMFSGHFLFEKNIPTVFKHPSTPFVVSWAVIRGLCAGLVRLAGSSRGR
jgi:hypothetical protein